MTEAARTNTGRIEASLEQPGLSLLAGLQAEQKIRLLNSSTLPDYFELSLEGLPAEWYSLTPETIHLFPNWAETVDFVVSLPLEAAPSFYPAYLTIVARSQPELRAEISFELRIPAPGGTASLVLVGDPAQAQLELSLEETRLTLAPGETSRQTLTLRNLTPRLDSFEVRLEGLPDGWGRLSASSCSLFPNWSDRLELDLSVASEAQPGLYNGRITVTSHDEPPQQSFVEFEIELPGPPPPPAELPPPAVDTSYNPDWQPQPEGPSEKSAWWKRSFKGSRKKQSKVALPAHNTPVMMPATPPIAPPPAIEAEPVPLLLPPPLSVAQGDRPTNKLQLALPPPSVNQQATSQKPQEVYLGLTQPHTPSYGFPPPQVAAPVVAEQDAPARPMDVSDLFKASAIPPLQVENDDVAASKVFRFDPTSLGEPSEPVAAPNLEQEATEPTHPQEPRPLQLSDLFPTLNLAVPEPKVAPLDDVPTSRPELEARAEGSPNAATEERLLPTPLYIVEVEPASTNVLALPAATMSAEIRSEAAVQQEAETPHPTLDVSDLFRIDRPTGDAVSAGDRPTNRLNEATEVPQTEVRASLAAGDRATNRVYSAAEPETSLATEASAEELEATFELGKASTAQPEEALETAEAAPAPLQVSDLFSGGKSNRPTNKLSGGSLPLSSNPEPPTEAESLPPPMQLADLFPTLAPPELRQGNRPTNKIFTAPEAAGPSLQERPTNRLNIQTSKLELSLEKRIVTVRAGQNSEQQLSLGNLTSQSDVFDLTIEGLPEGWYFLSTSSLYLFPNWHQELYLRIAPPRDSEPGSYEAVIRVASQSGPGQRAEGNLQIEVLAASLQAVPDEPDELSDTPRLDLEVETLEMSVRLGDSTVQQISITNLIGRADTIELSIEGLPDNWYNFSSSTLYLFHNWNEHIYVRIAPLASDLPGIYPVWVRAFPQNHPELAAEIELELNVQNEVEALSLEDLWRRPAGATPAALPAPSSTASNSQQIPLELLEALGPAYAQTASSSTPASAAVPPPAAPVPVPARNSEIPRELLAMLGPAYAQTPPPRSAPPVYHPNQNIPTAQPFRIAAPVLNAAPGAPALLPPPPPPAKKSWFNRVFGGGQAEVTPPPYGAADAGSPPLNGRPPGAGGPPPIALWQPVPNQSQSNAGPTTTNLPPPGQAGGGRSLTLAGAIPAPNRPGPPALARRSPTDMARVQVQLGMPRMTIVAGESAEQKITLTNLTNLPDDFKLSVEGLPTGWFSFSRDSVNMFPNWSEAVDFKVTISTKVRPDQYVGRLIAYSLTQPAVRTEVRLEILVLAQLKVEARLQPHRAKGYRANYELFIRNRSQCQGLLSLQMSPGTEFCVGQFVPSQVAIPAGQGATVKVAVQLKPKTPAEQAQQQQPFEILVQPEFMVENTPIKTAELLVEGQYIHESRWAIIGRYPRLFVGLAVLLVVVLLWNLIIWSINSTVLELIDRQFKPRDSVAARSPLRYEQAAYTQVIQTRYNPFKDMAEVKVFFYEETPTDKQVVKLQITLFGLFLNELEGKLSVNDNGELVFKSIKEGQTNSFPWTFAPPDQIVARLNKDLRIWLSRPGSNKRLDKPIIEGNTLYLTLKECKPGEEACRITTQR